MPLGEVCGEIFPKTLKTSGYLLLCVYVSKVLAKYGGSICLKGRKEHLEGCGEGMGRTVWY